MITEQVRLGAQIGTVELLTPRLRIREIEPGDLADLFEHWSATTYLEHVPVEPYTHARVEAAIERARIGRSEDPRRHFLLVACDAVSGRFVGDASLDIRKLSWRQAEIGYAIRHDQTGKGLGTELALAMRDFGFMGLGLHRIYAQCRVENSASCRIMTKLGMTLEGVLRDNVRARGKWWSSVQCSILATEIGREER